MMAIQEKMVLRVPEECVEKLDLLAILEPLDL